MSNSIIKLSKNLADITDEKQNIIDEIKSKSEKINFENMNLQN